MIIDVIIYIFTGIGFILMVSIVITTIINIILDFKKFLFIAGYNRFKIKKIKEEIKEIKERYNV